MFEEVGVIVMKGKYFKLVIKEGLCIIVIVIDNGIYKVKVFVDGIYEGDFMVSVGVDWMIGCEGCIEYGEFFVGK